MKTKRQRLVVTSAQKLRLSSHRYLRFDEKRKAWAVLAPEHVYWPDETSLAILRKLDGERDVESLIVDIAAEYCAPEETVRSDVMDFLQQWADEHLILSSGGER